MCKILECISVLASAAIYGYTGTTLVIHDVFCLHAEIKTDLKSIGLGVLEGARGTV
jgi:hypothetical protein